MTDIIHPSIIQPAGKKPGQELILQCAIESNQKTIVICVLAFIYVISMFGNLLVVVVVILNPQLHAPMYIYISTLAVIDLANSSVLIPKMLSVLLLGSSVVPYGACVLQMFLVHHVDQMESLLLAFMAFDRYIAVVYPLRYPSVITNKIVVIGILIANIFGVIFKSPNLIFVFEIAMAAIRISSAGRKSKVFSTCVTHLFVIGLFYVPLLLSFILPGAGVTIPTETYNIMFILGNVVPPMMNPLIYSLRNKEINNSIHRLFTRKR
uniref:G-protein coupled receptors family 1 profile domain-containing protein n=1 Tax=Erpetoichthys calabaricus TaxID=27687 RepID=A0A8C4SVP5_ERPCA